jgi:hypothetical protein
MKSIRVGLLLAILGVMGVSGGCNPFRRSKPPPPPPTPTAKPMPQITAHPPAQPEKPKPLPLPPKVEEPPVASLPPPPIETTPPQPPPRRRPARSQAPPPSPEPSEPAEVPRLTQLLTPEQEKEYNHEIDESLERVRQNLASIRGRALNQEQTGVLLRIQAFVQQTQEARKVDLVTAQSLAQRADLLAQDLVQSMR